MTGDVNYVLAPTGWDRTDPNPFTGKPFDPTWSGIFFLKHSDQFLNRTEPNGLYCASFGRKTASLQIRVTDFLRYERAQGRKTIVGTDADFGIDDFLHQSLANTPEPDILRPTDPRYIVHATSLEAWESIQTDRMLKSPVRLREQGISFVSVGFRELGEPPEYDEFVHFGAYDRWHSEFIVLSQQMGRICTENDTVYTPGIRLYIDNHKVISDGHGVRDGLHLIKVESELPLGPYLVAAIAVDDVDPEGTVKEWTPKSFFQAADDFLRGRVLSKA